MQVAACLLNELKTKRINILRHGQSYPLSYQKCILMCTVCADRLQETAMKIFTYSPFSVGVEP